MNTEEQKIEYLTRLFEEAYLKDIIERHRIEKTQELEGLINIPASAEGPLLMLEMRKKEYCKPNEAKWLTFGAGHCILFLKYTEKKDEEMGKGIFVTGTGTDVGKTYVTALILKKIKEEGMNPGYFKAAMSGNERKEDGALIPGDALWVKDISGIAQPLKEMCPYVYEHAYSPHLASRLEGNPVELRVVMDEYRKVKEKYDYITVEGSGGILCPICFDEARIGLTDVIDEMELDCILVADAGLGTINSVVLTYEYMKNRNMNIKGIIFNRYIADDIMHEDNIRMCEYLTGLPTLAKVSEGDKDLNIDAAKLISVYR